MFQETVPDHSDFIKVHRDRNEVRLSKQALIEINGQLNLPFEGIGFIKVLTDVGRRAVALKFFNDIISQEERTKGAVPLNKGGTFYHPTMKLFRGKRLYYVGDEYHQAAKWRVYQEIENVP